MRRAWFWIALVAVLVAGTGASAWQRSRLVPLPPEPTPVPSSDVGSYRIVYAMRDTAQQDKLVRSTEIVEVERPYSARIETREGPPPGGELLSGSVTNRDFFWNLQKGGEAQFGMRRPPGTAHRDTSFVVLREAAAAGLADERRSERVLRRRCTVFAFKEPRPQPLAPPTQDDSVEACVTPDGIVLREAWRLKGRVVLRRQAVELDVNTQIPDERFRIGETPDPAVEANRLITQSQAVTEDGKPEGRVHRPDPPRGFESDRTAMHFESGGGQGPPRNSWFRSYVRGPEVVVVDEGSYRSSSPPWNRAEGEPIRLSRRWTARVVYLLDQAEVRLWRSTGGDLPETQFLRVQAPSRDLGVWFAKTAVS